MTETTVNTKYVDETVHTFQQMRKNLGNDEQAQKVLNARR